MSRQFGRSPNISGNSVAGQGLAVSQMYMQMSK